MTSNIGQYEHFLDTLAEDLSQILREEEVDSNEKIQRVVACVMAQFREGLEASQMAKKDFINTRVENWGDKLLSPLAEFARTHFAQILNRGEPLDQKEDFECENIPSIEELATQVEACIKKRDKLFNYLEKQASFRK